MECNRDEAQRCMEIAEGKFIKNDLKGAKKFALKAQTLFPLLDGISQFITALDVHLMAESRVGSEKNWYDIMSLSSSADDLTLKKRYRHLALHLHPDKNKSPGAESAFKLVKEAFEVLKDKFKRQMFDQKLKTYAVNGQKKGAAGSGSSNGFSNVQNTVGCDIRSKFQAQSAPQRATGPVPWPPWSTAGCSAKGASQTASRPVPRPQKRSSAQGTSQATRQPVQRPPNPNTSSSSARGTSKLRTDGARQRTEQQAAQPSEKSTFWTRCTFCRMWFEYELIFLDHRLQCRSCSASFDAAAAGRPVCRYKFEKMQAWRCSNLHPTEGSDSRSSSKPGSSANASDRSDDQHRSYKRMRGEGSTAANGSSC